MLKKAGIVVATAAAGLLAVSPLAFAGDLGYSHGHGHDHGKSPSHSVEYKNSKQCNFAPQSSVNYVPQDATGVTSPLLGILGVAANAAAPVTTQLQTPILSCNNFQDVANVDVHDNLNHNHVG